MTNPTTHHKYSSTKDIQGYTEFLGALKSSIRQRQYQALRTVNKELIALYWDIGKLIDERQETEGWGKAVVERLSADLRDEFGEKSGFSVQNLWYMRKFYREYKTLPNLQPMAGEISWTKNTFEFLDLAEAHEERELEAALIANVQGFLTEMGPNFTFVGSQYRLIVDGNDYYIDLLLYHRALKSLIAVELKIGEFQPEHKGKMEFYLVALNEQVKLADENDAIGIIICKSKKKTVVEYALKTTTQPIGIATYSLTPHLPAAYQHLLPSEDEIRERLQGWEEKA